MTIDAPSGLSSSVATSVARTRCTVTGAVIEWENVVSLTSTIACSRSRGSIGVQCSSCIAIADHARATTGGVEIGPSATTTVLSVGPPRIIPPYTPKNMTSRPSSVAARATTWAASWTP
jgi:hypothetical protein